MARAAVSALVVLAVLVCVRAARFGDRLAPRLPAYTPRHANVHHARTEYENDADYDYDPEPDGDKPHDEPEPEPQTSPPPRRPVRTEAHRLEMSTEYFALPHTTSAPVPPPPPRAPPPHRAPDPTHNVTVTTRTATGPRPPRALLRDEPWAVPVLALACVLMATVAAFEAFVVWGARRTAPSRRHLLLGQSLLFGLFWCAATAALYAATPTAFVCGAVRFATGTSYAIVFASLLVKCVFLLSLNGGVYLPAAYQGLLLFFAVMIQVAIGAQWLGSSPPGAEGGRCRYALSELLLSLVYAAALAATVCGVALRSRAIRDNYREAWHIAGAGGAAAAVWACWVAAALGAPDRLRDACPAAGLLATCAVVFALMFGPKGRRLAALGRECRRSDRDECASSADAGGSGYSPSFFHFKPVKYGMVSAAAPPPERKEPPAHPADPFAGLAFAPHARAACPPPHYFPHPFLHYHNYPPYHFYLPPGVTLRPEDGVYTTLEPTFSTNPNVYFHRSEPLHVGMMY